MSSGLKKTLKVLKIAASAAWWCVLVLLALLLMNIIGAKIKGKVPSVFGYSVMNIISDSMGEQMPRGSYILVKRIDAEDVKVDDVICFYSSDPAIFGFPNTHRVVEEPIVTEDGIEFVTKGDASGANDKVNAKGENLIGVYVKRLESLERFVAALDSGILIIVIICLLMGMSGMFVYSAIIAQKNENAEKDETKKKD